MVCTMCCCNRLNSSLRRILKSSRNSSCIRRSSRCPESTRRSSSRCSDSLITAASRCKRSSRRLVSRCNATNSWSRSANSRSRAARAASACGASAVIRTALTKPTFKSLATALTVMAIRATQIASRAKNLVKPVLPTRSFPEFRSISLFTSNAPGGMPQHSALVQNAESAELARLEECPELELESLCFILRLCVERPTQAHGQRPYRRVPNQSDADRITELVGIDRTRVSIEYVAGVPKCQQSHRVEIGAWNRTDQFHPAQ